ncbi:Angelicin synthase [Bertholletia excelsa]
MMLQAEQLLGGNMKKEKEGKKIKQLFRELLELLSGPDIGDLVPGCWWISRVNGSNAEAERVAKGLDEFREDVVEDRMNGFRTNSACGGKSGIRQTGGFFGYFT